MFKQGQMKSYPVSQELREIQAQEWPSSLTLRLPLPDSVFHGNARELYLLQFSLPQMRQWWWQSPAGVPWPCPVWYPLYPTQNARCTVHRTQHRQDDAKYWCRNDNVLHTSHVPVYVTCPTIGHIRFAWDPWHPMLTWWHCLIHHNTILFLQHNHGSEYV